MESCLELSYYNQVYGGTPPAWARKAASRRWFLVSQCFWSRAMRSSIRLMSAICPLLHTNAYSSSRLVPQRAWKAGFELSTVIPYVLFLGTLHFDELQ